MKRGVVSSEDEPFVRELSELKSRLQALEEHLSRLDALEERLSSLEGARREVVSEARAVEPATPSPVAGQTVSRRAEPRTPEAISRTSDAISRTSDAEEEVVGGEEPLVTAGTVPLIGRTLLVLGGAFLLRAITEGGLVPEAVGSVLGLIYAVAWLVFADRVGATRERVGDATFHGIATALIAFPLLWETTLTFEILPPVASAGALFVIAATGIGVAWHRRIPALAWVVGGGAVPAAVALGFATRVLPPFLLCLLAVGVAILWLGHRLGSFVLNGLVALLVDAVFLLLVVVVLLEPESGILGGLEAPMLLGLLTVLVAGYWGSTVARTIVRRHEVGWLELVQLVATFGVGVVGGVVLSLSRGIPQAAVAGTLIVLGIASYAAAFGRVERRQGRGRTFHVFALAALALVLMSLPLLVEPRFASIAFIALGVAGSWLGARLSRATFSLHGSAFVLAGAVASGMVVAALDGLVGSAGSVEAWGSPPVLVALAGTAAVTAFPPKVAPDALSAVARIAGALVSLTLVLSVSAVLCNLGAAWLPEDGHPAALATLRTGVLVATAVALAGAGRSERWTDLRWVAYGIFVAGAAKLLLEDLRVGHAATLFVSLVLYGGALILVSRLVRRAAEETKGAETEVRAGAKGVETQVGAGGEEAKRQ